MEPLTVRLVSCAPRSGQENMAIDEYLHSWHMRTNRPFLRIYRWSPPSITMGRYQPVSCLDVDSCRARGVSIIRRITGGGAIYHDREVTYSLACGERDIDGRPLSVVESFEIMNKIIIRLYRMLGLPALFAKDIPACRTGVRRPDFCFSGNEGFDILIHGMKIGGNAQRRSGGSIFQHGTIPLVLDEERIRSCFKIPIDFRNFTTLDRIAGHMINEELVMARLKDAFVISTGWRLKPSELDADEMDHVREIMERRYLNERWNLEGRTEDDEEVPAAMAQ
ncbi:MAG: lipoate--protein ligase family protein [Spirochaetes bacterium]|nr:lipoate--protein ligase family protein [Spirochaetota bacterium]